jgi:hypothetical protein
MARQNEFNDQFKKSPLWAIPSNYKSVKADIAGEHAAIPSPSIAVTQ